MEDLESMLTFNTSLQELGLAKTQLTAQGFTTLFKSLTKNESLRA